MLHPTARAHSEVRIFRPFGSTDLLRRLARSGSDAPRAQAHGVTRMGKPGGNVGAAAGAKKDGCALRQKSAIEGRGKQVEKTFLAASRWKASGLLCKSVITSRVQIAVKTSACAPNKDGHSLSALRFALPPSIPDCGRPRRADRGMARADRGPAGPRNKKPDGRPQQVRGLPQEPTKYHSRRKFGPRSSPKMF